MLLYGRIGSVATMLSLSQWKGLEDSARRGSESLTLVHELERRQLEVCWPWETRCWINNIHKLKNRMLIWLVQMSNSVHTVPLILDVDRPATDQLGTLRVSLTGRLVTFGSVYMSSDVIVAFSRQQQPSKRTLEQFDDACAPNHIMATRAYTKASLDSNMR